MIGHVSAGPLRTYVKVANCCEPSSAGTLACVKTTEICVEGAFATVYMRFTIADRFLCFREDD
jgi:hypothetical protein